MASNTSYDVSIDAGLTKCWITGDLRHYDAQVALL